MELHFRVTCADTRFGWHVRVVGSCPELGSWDPREGAVLATSEVDFPDWHSVSTVSFDSVAAFEYKYVICDDLGNGVRWENTPNRVLCLAPEELGDSRQTLVVTERWNLTCQVDRLHFVTGLRGSPRSSSAAPSAASPRTPSDGRSLVNFLAHLEGASLIQPTLREAQRLRSFLAPERAGSLCNLGAPELVDAVLEERLSKVSCMSETGSEQSHDEGNMIVREASCSNLFYGEELDQESDEDVPAAKFEDRYALCQKGLLGEGSFGQVWRCSRVDGREQALAAKVVCKARLNAREQRLLLGEGGEIQLHLEMKHPHVVELVEYFDESLTATLVLELCHGGDLFDAIQAAARTPEGRNGSRGLPEHQAAVAAQHTLAALAYVHSHHVVHRDVKCENVLLAKAGVPLEQNVFKLCDFGFAARDDGHGLQDKLGSPDTVAPEVISGRRYSLPADLWSAGSIIYMMLAARSPFKAPTDADVLRKVRSGSYNLNGAPWNAVTDHAKHVITSLMVMDPKLRPTAKEALAKGWFRDVKPVAVPAKEVQQ